MTAPTARSTEPSVRQRIGITVYCIAMLLALVAVKVLHRQPGHAGLLLAIGSLLLLLPLDRSPLLRLWLTLAIGAVAVVLSALGTVNSPLASLGTSLMALVPIAGVLSPLRLRPWRPSGSVGSSDVA